jgi:CDP-diacylglycerol pyrophosphatase
MKTTKLFLTVAIVGLTVAGSLAAQEKPMKEATIKGEIIDSKCYLTGMMGGKGEEHKDCAIACIKGGLPVAILEEKTGKVYVVVPAKGQKGANEALVQYAAETVTLKGMFIEKGGTKLFAYSSVESGK